MSEDTQKTVSEETISAIVSAAQNIADDSTAMRKNLIKATEALQPMIEEAGIRYGSLDDEQMWTAGSYPDQVTRRIGIKRYDGKIRIGVEETQYPPESWDGSNWVGHPDPFSDDAYANRAATIVSFADTSRRTVACIIERLPAFIEAYAAELKREHQKYSDLRKMADRMNVVIEEDTA